MKIRSKIMMFFHRCDCGGSGDWIYMPGYKNGDNPYFCDTCVPRTRCSCTYEDTMEYYFCMEHQLGDIYFHKFTERTSKHFELLDNGMWIRLDDLGRSEPCCEFDNLKWRK